MKTAVEWLINEMPVIDWKDPYWKIKLEKAKEMEKEQMLNAFQESRLTHPMIGFKHETFLDYYKQFKQKEQ
jgi:hypothetical protein